MHKRRREADETENRIKAIDPTSPLRGKAEIGESLVSINGNRIIDVLDYKFYAYDRSLTVVLRRADGMKSAKLKAYKKEIDGLVFVFPRMIPLLLPEGGEVGRLERPLRASTAQGERVCLEYSETVPEGTTQEFDIVVMRDALLPYVIEWLKYGEMRGMGQWRNSGCGRFMFRFQEVR